jgi:hypothetical protein
VIVTFNLSDFPQQALAAYGIEAQHPEAFLSHLFDEAPETFLAVIRKGCSWQTLPAVFRA